MKVECGRCHKEVETTRENALKGNIPCDCNKKAFKAFLTQRVSDDGFVPDKQTFTIYGTLDGLNEYTKDNRTPSRKTGRMGAKNKRDNENIVKEAISKSFLVRIEDPITVNILWVEKNRKRDPDNIAFGKKYILDALRDYTIIPGDGHNNIRGFSDIFAFSKNNPHILVELKKIYIPEG